MRKQIDWQAEEARAAGMTEQELLNAKGDARETAKLWRVPGTDSDGNWDFYMDQVSVYARELKKRWSHR